MTNEKEPDRLDMEKIKLERLEGQLKQQEMKYLGEFLSNALVDDYEKRFRFADYFATLTSSPKLQQKWIDYRDGIVKTKRDLEEKEAKLAKAQKAGEKDNLKELETDVARLQAQLDPLPKKRKVYLDNQRRR